MAFGTKPLNQLLGNSAFLSFSADIYRGRAMIYMNVPVRGEITGTIEANSRLGGRITIPNPDTVTPPSALAKTLAIGTEFYLYVDVNNGTDDHIRYPLGVFHPMSVGYSQPTASFDIELADRWDWFRIFDLPFFNNWAGGYFYFQQDQFTFADMLSRAMLRVLPGVLSGTLDIDSSNIQVNNSTLRVRPGTDITRRASSVVAILDLSHSNFADLVMSTSDLAAFYDREGYPTLDKSIYARIKDGTHDWELNPEDARVEGYSFKAEGFYNQVSVSYPHPTLGSTYTQAADVDPNSPTYLFGPAGYRTKLLGHLPVATQAEAEALIANVLKIVVSTDAQMTVTIPACWAIDPGDVIRVINPTNGRAANFLVAQITYPLGPGVTNLTLVKCSDFDQQPWEV
ncbi:hypothetical protein Lfu02_54890 [Longispora fulva]|uniref:Uncharacterized protein n=1 Tax=Longispora fulva TaxID=619741 RepID=A0A8J7GEZ1_9ACTN|nr:hypothetical protein [Longispora fulva]MBG6137529.1 hypothetical protein [Longispora fulva]GIG61117.1 hypothetical protein Lfu02_54890 [Longispora fulva]